MLTETTKALIRADAKTMTRAELFRELIYTASTMPVAPSLHELDQRQLLGDLRLILDIALAAEGGKVLPMFKLYAG